MSSILIVVANSEGRIFVDQNDVSVQMILAWLFFNIDEIDKEIYTINRRYNNGLWSMVNSCDEMTAEDIIVVSEESEYASMNCAVVFDSLLEITHDNVISLEKIIENSHGRAYEQVEDFSEEYFDDVSYMPNLYYKDDLLCNRDYRSEKVNIINGLRYTPNTIGSAETIHFFGDSRMYGLYVSDQYTIPSLVSEKLKRKCVNYGTHGTSIFDIKLQIENATIKNGDIVVINNGFIKSKKIVEQPIVDAAAVYEILQINDECISRGAELVVCMFPDCGDKKVLLPQERNICIFQELQKIEQSNSNYYSLDANWEKVIPIIKSYGIKCCDIISRIYYEQEVQIFVDYIHFGAVGNELISDLLSKCIVSEEKNRREAVLKEEKYKKQIFELKDDYKRIICERRGDINSAFFDNDKFDEFIALLGNCSVGKTDGSAVIVMNANPFTYGHLYIIEEALKLVPYIYILVVQEKQTVIPFEDRIDLIKKGTEHLDNISIIPSSEFVVSNVTLPEYFNKERKQLQNVDATRDIALFIEYIMPALNVETRIAGYEPYCKVTKEYNRQIAERFAEKGLKFIQLERKKLSDSFISASKVRRAVFEGRIFDIREMVPDSTYEYLLRKQEMIRERMHNWEVD